MNKLPTYYNLIKIYETESVRNRANVQKYQFNEYSAIITRVSIWEKDLEQWNKKHNNNVISRKLNIFSRKTYSFPRLHYKSRLPPINPYLAEY